jgi:hypothetical protein
MAVGRKEHLDNKGRRMMTQKATRCEPRACIANAMRIFLSGAFIALLFTPAAQAWTANWIWQSVDGPVNTWLCLRKTVTLSAKPTVAPTRIAAENKYWLYVNGQLVVPGGGMDIRPDLTNTYYDSLDLAPYLVAGNNIIAVLVWHKGGNNGYSQHMVAKGGFLFESALSGATPAAIISDNTWKVLVHPSFAQTTQSQQWSAYKWVEYPVSYDARNSPGDWTALSFSDNAWAAASQKGVPPAAPWNSLVYRTIPFHKLPVATAYLNQASLPTSFSKNTTFTGQVGINTQGYAYLRITAPAGVYVAIRMNEWYTENYVTTSGTQEYTTYQWQNTSGQPWSAHDVEYAFTNVTGTVTITSVNFQQFSFATDCIGSFSCNNTRLNTLWTKCRNTSYVCMHDQFFDCPDRERGQWWGDVSEQILYSFYLWDSNASLLAKKGLRELMNTQKTDYSLYTTAPGTDFELPDQNLAAVASICDYFLYTGDSALVRELYPKVATYIKNYVAGTRDGSGMLILRDGPWNWIDWGNNMDIQTGSANTVVNGLFVRLMDAAKVMATVCGNSADVTTYNGYETSVRNNFNTYFWNAKSKAYVFDRLNGAQSTTIDDRSNAWGVLAGVTDSAKQAGVLRILNSQQNASPYQERYIEDAMFVMGKDREALTRMLSFYQPNINSWSTTMWENSDASGSNNHAWAASACYLLGAYVTGILPTAAGYSTYHVLPLLGNLTAASVIVPTVKGLITSSDSLTGNQFVMHLTSPSATIATVGIPQRDSATILSVSANGTTIWQNGSFLGGVTGIASAAEDARFLKFTAAPGTWTFAATYNKSVPAVNLALGAKVTGCTSLESSDWGMAKLTDGITTSVTGSMGYTSDPTQGGPNNHECVTIDLGKNTAFNRIKIYPRTDVKSTTGGAPNWPANYTIQVEPDGGSYAIVQTVTNDSNNTAQPKTCDFTGQNARYIKIDVTKLGVPASDEAGNYRLQLAEVEAYNIVTVSSQPRTAGIVPAKALGMTMNSRQIVFHVACLGAYALRVFDAAGKTHAIYRGRDQGSFVLARTMLSRGVYFAQLTSAGESVVKEIAAF